MTIRYGAEAEKAESIKAALRDTSRSLRSIARDHATSHRQVARLRTELLEREGWQSETFTLPQNDHEREMSLREDLDDATREIARLHEEIDGIRAQLQERLATAFG